MTTTQGEQQPLKALYNPDTEDFEWEYLDDANVSHVAKIPAMTVMMYPEWLANLLTTHLVDFIYHKRGQKENSELDKTNIRKEIENVTVLNQ